jgi:hypothetical protein
VFLFASVGLSQESRVTARPGPTIVCPVKVDWHLFRPTKGDIVRYEIKEETTLESHIGLRDRRRKGEITRLVEIRILDVNADGDVQIEYRCTNVRGAFVGGKMDSLEVDSSKPDPQEEDSNKRLWRTLIVAEVGHPLVLSLNKSATISSARGLEGIRKASFTVANGITESLEPIVEPLFTEEHYCQMLQSLFPQLRRPTDQGTAISWVPERGLHWCPGLGGQCENLAVTARLAASTKEEFQIDTATPEPETRASTDYAPLISAKSRAALSQRDGLVNKAIIDVRSVSSFPSSDGNGATTTTSRTTIIRLLHLAPTTLR